MPKCLFEFILILPAFTSQHEGYSVHSLMADTAPTYSAAKYFIMIDKSYHKFSVFLSLTARLVVADQTELMRCKVVALNIVTACLYSCLNSPSRKLRLYGA